MQYRTMLMLWALLLLVFAQTACASENREIILQKNDLGIEASVIRTEGDCVEARKETDGSVRITALREGEAEVTVQNTYSESVQIAVSVAPDGSLSWNCTPFQPPVKSVNILDYGAVPNDAADDTSAIQQAIDSLTEGGTVYIPAGIYDVSHLEFRQGIHLRLAGCLERACNGYTAETAAWVSGGQTAILHTTGMSAHLFYNLPVGGYCTEGVDDFSLSGGVIDCANRTMAFVWACADGVTLENCIIKDGPNDHAIQIDGCSNVTIRNVMFAGYKYNGVKTRETIQIEPTTDIAISGQYEGSPVKCKRGDFHFNQNIVITGCYFGKSDVSGPQLAAVGHHSVMGGKAVVDGFEFSGNVVDNPLMYGLHLLDFANAQIYGNTFISTEGDKPLARDTALISLDAISEDGLYPTDDGRKVTYACDFEVEANRQINMHDNRFILGGGTPLRALYINGTRVTPGASAVQGLLRADTFESEPFSYTGYLLNRNYFEDVRFCDNEIIVESLTRYMDHALFVAFVYDFVYEGNTLTVPFTYSSVSSQNGETVRGMLTSMIRNGSERRIVIEGRPDAAFGICLADADGKTSMFPCHAKANVSVIPEEGGQVTLNILKDGSVVLQPVADPGFRFAGWCTKGGIPVDAARAFWLNTEMTASFERN